jgi:hypothetical protein
MIKFQSKKTFLFLSTQVLFFVYQQIFPQELKLTAENVIFDKNNNIVIAEENVKLQYKNIFLETQKLFYDTHKNIVYISTDVFLSYLGNKLFAKSLQYDVNSEKITIQNFYSFYEPYYSYSKFCSVEKEKLLLEEAKVTHCDLKIPHYYLKSKKVVIYPYKEIKLYSPMLVLRKTPVLWVPYYSISLKPSKDYFYIDPSYENERGLIMKIKYGRQLNNNFDLRFMCNVYSLESLGLGSELEYRSSLYNGIIYLYLVNNFKNENTQINLRINNNHKLSSTWSLKTNVEYMSNEQFYNLYEKENWFIVKRDINSGISLSRDTQRTSLRFSYLRYDSFDLQQEKFVNKYYKTPISFTIYPFSLGIVKFNESFSITPTLIESSTYYTVLSENNFSVFVPIKLFRIVSISPTIASQSFLNFYPENKLFYNTYSFSLPLKFYPLTFCSFDLSYNYRIRSLDNSFNIDFSSYVLTNSLSPRLDLFYKQSFLRFYTYYNFLLKPEDDLWYKKFSVFNTDIGSSYKKFSFFIHTEYEISKNIIQNLQTSLGYKFDFNNRINVTYSKNYFQDKNSVSTDVNIYIPNNLQLKIRNTLDIDKEKVDLVNTNLELYKDLHCWEAKVFCNMRRSISATIPYVFEIGGFVGLKFKPYVGAKVSEIDKLYFPWRE